MCGPSPWISARLNSSDIRSNKPRDRKTPTITEVLIIPPAHMLMMKRVQSIPLSAVRRVGPAASDLKAFWFRSLLAMRHLKEGLKLKQVSIYEPSLQHDSVAVAEPVQSIDIGSSSVVRESHGHPRPRRLADSEAAALDIHLLYRSVEPLDGRTGLGNLPFLYSPVER